MLPPCSLLLCTGPSFTLLLSYKIFTTKEEHFLGQRFIFHIWTHTTDMSLVLDCMFEREKQRKKSIWKIPSNLTDPNLNLQVQGGVLKLDFSLGVLKTWDFTKTLDSDLSIYVSVKKLSTLNFWYCHREHFKPVYGNTTTKL